MIREPLIQHLQDVTWKQVQDYLVATGWTNSGPYGKFALIWHRADRDDAQVLLPTSEEAVDFWDRMADAVESLARVEQRSITEVIEALSGHFGDTIRIRVIHDDVEVGTIPAIDGVALNEQALALLTAASMSYLTKRHYHQRPTALTNAFLETLRLGQTERGSYVVNLFAALPPSPIGQPPLDGVPMTNNVITNLTSGLKALTRAIGVKGKQKDVHKALDEAVSEGASANMCDALVGLSGSQRTRDFEVLITASRPGGYVPPPVTFKFSKEKVERLAKASEYYRRDYTAKSKVVQGYIKRLDRPHGEEHGSIWVAAQVDGVEKLVEIDLGPVDYKNAIAAHLADEEVQCSGDVLIKARSAVLLTPTRFKVLHEGVDLFKAN
ncbi:hypothetical protein [Burkholderia ambifaria]|jgi:hypothetical protein|uniref:hypothetical protein n=1 Tax=Burkholderia ambifaria TaxID=152480 RepID=UPI001BA35B24|nr:hypothetical protein [Burkholderia ambifaria]MBR8223700.1 hypothetical protein [Burkholderia ambifaria]